MEHKTRAIVLRMIKYGEDKYIIDFLTHDLGRESSVWKISKSRNAKVVKQLFQPLAIMDIVVDHGNSDVWYTLDGVRLSGRPKTKGIYVNNGKKVLVK